MRAHDFNLIRRAASSLSILLLALLLTANCGASAERSKKLEELLVVMGFDSEFDGRAHRLKLSAQQAPANMSNRKSFVEAAMAAADKAFSESKMYQKFSSQLDRKITSSEVDAMMGFYNTPLALRMAELEKKAESETGGAEIERDANELEKMLRDDPERVENFENWNRLLHLDQLSIDTSLHLYKAVMLGLAAGLGNLNAHTVELIDKEIERRRVAAGPEALRAIRLSWAYTYRTISNSDFRRYLKFMETPVHRKFYDAYVYAVNKTYVDSGLEYSQSILKELRAKEL